MCVEQEENVRRLSFQERTINGINFLNMLQQFLTPQIDEDDQERKVYFMQDGAPPHHLTAARDFLNGRSRGQRIGLHAPIAIDHPVPQTSHFFFWGVIKDMMYVPHLPATLLYPRARINAVTEQITPEMLMRVGENMDYQWDVCRVQDN